MSWLAEQRIPLLRVDWQGGVVSLLGNVPQADPEKVRLQRAVPNLVIAISLVRHKLINSVITLERMIPASDQREQSIASLSEDINELDGARPSSIAALLGIEGRAAQSYFGAWRDLPLSWGASSRSSIPETWHHIGPRQSANGGKKGKNRRASHPVNAMLNYAYAVLESEVRTQIITAGYDPTIGYLHAYQPDRQALVFDLMEPFRPLVDQAVLAFIEAHTFRHKDFLLRSDGVCRLNPEMARRLIQSINIPPVASATIQNLLELKAGTQLRSDAYL